MTYKYKLCITIPTYNREKYLKRLLNSIVSQKSFSSEISVVINDWPSKDNTEKMVMEFQKQYKNIFYYRNEKAVWMLPAILESMDMSNWEYTWLFWSDDFLDPNSIWNIIKCINEHSPKIIYSRRKEVEYWKEIVDSWGELEILTFKWILEFSKYLWDKTKWTFHDKDVFFTFMSVFCINSDYYKKSYDNLINNIWYSESELKKNYFNFNLVALANVKNSDIISVVNEPICVYCEEHNHWWIRERKIYKDLSFMLKIINSIYTVPFSCKKFFFKLKLRRWGECWWNKVYIGWLKLLKTLWIYNIIAKIFKKL